MTRRARRTASLLAAWCLAAPWPGQAQADADGPACYDPVRIGPLVELRTSGPLYAVVAPMRGGELVSLRFGRRNRPTELLYRGMDFCDRPGWGGKAPILWPATGRNHATDAPGGAGWMWNGTIFPMPIHGFARDLPWRVVAQATGRRSSFVQLELTDSPATRAMYPFRFRFTITYRLEHTRLAIEHAIIAEPENQEEMPFSIGNHITFRQPVATDAGAMLVTTPASGRVELDAQGRPVADVAQAPLRRFPVNRFADGVAVPLTGYRSAPWLRLDDPGGLRLRLSHRASRSPDRNPVLFNLWGNSELGFFSPEPWMGRQNSLVDNTGLIRLAPGADFNWTIRISVAD